MHYFHSDFINKSSSHLRDSRRLELSEQVSKFSRISSASFKTSKYIILFIRKHACMHIYIYIYIAETWCLKAKTVAKLNSTEIDFWRRSARISRKDKVRNNIMKQEMNVTRSLLEDINTKQLKWYGHVQRMEEGRLSIKKVIKLSPPGRRKQGRPKITWVEGIRGLMEENGFMEEDWNDRHKWRKKII